MHTLVPLLLHPWASFPPSLAAIPAPLLHGWAEQASLGCAEAHRRLAGGAGAPDGCGTSAGALTELLGEAPITVLLHHANRSSAPTTSGVLWSSPASPRRSPMSSSSSRAPVACYYLFWFLIFALMDLTTGLIQGLITGSLSREDLLLYRKQR